MSALEQYFLEREAANRLREARDFAERERLPNSSAEERARARRQLTRWAVLCLALVGLAFMISLV